MRLWTWAKRVYGAPQVARLCLALQDEAGQSVCLLLWAGWAAAHAPRASERDLAQAVALAKVWESDVIAPLRAARRGLTHAPGLSEAARARLRARVTLDERAAERRLLEALEALTPAHAGAAADAAAAMARACALWDAPAPPAALAALAAAFPRA